MGINWLLTLRGIPQLYYGTEIGMKNFKTHPMRKCGAIFRVAGLATVQINLKRQGERLQNNAYGTILLRWRISAKHPKPWEKAN
jgi:glycosidase